MTDLSIDYRQMLRDSWRKKRAEFGRSFSMTSVAKACQVQKTYLSRVLKGDGHLSADQIFRACRYLGLSRDEEQILTMSSEHDRSAIPERKRELAEAIHQRLKKLHQTDAHLSAVIVDSEFRPELAEYYLNPESQLVHQFLAIERYADDLNAIARDLSLSMDQLRAIIENLKAIGLIAFVSGKYEVTTRSLHLAETSPLFSSQKILVRLRSLERLRKLSASQAYAFSVTFSADKKTRDEIKQQWLQLLKKVQGMVQTASCDRVYQMNFDLFPWDSEF